MPSEHLVAVVHDQTPDVAAQQIKFCSQCHSTLVEHAVAVSQPTSIYRLPDATDVLVCQTCRDHIRLTTPRLSPQQQQQQAPNPGVHFVPGNVQHEQQAHQQRASRLDSYYINRPTPAHEAASRRQAAQDALVPEIDTTRINVNTASSSSGSNQVSPAASGGAGEVTALSYHRHVSALAGPSSSQQQQQPQASSSTLRTSSSSASGASIAPGKGANGGLGIVTTLSALPATSISALSPSVARRPQHQHCQQPHLDPLADITRFRVRSQGHHSLYPGATFEGTQKSGRNSYDVTVTIIDVDFSSSFLCGYLRIKGLTDDWPELTTYFDAEIIGSRYGFLTQNWGATEHEDMVHWARFPAFKHVKGEAKKPLMTIDDRDRGAVFMRWKEKFLVPDHRVQDISGASFAGFYYVCVDFNSQYSHNVAEDEVEQPSAGPGTSPITGKSDSTSFQSRRRRASSTRRRSPSRVAPRAPPKATMSGFYYHRNSEPYQQLSLAHVQEETSSTFEFR